MPIGILVKYCWELGKRVLAKLGRERPFISVGHTKPHYGAGVREQRQPYHSAVRIGSKYVHNCVVCSYHAHESELHHN